MQFFKMNSIGNDFVVIEQQNIFNLDDISLTSKRLCDRKYGVGADQAVFFSYRTGLADVRFFNQDGTEAEMCGNGIRALGLLLNRLYHVNSISAKTLASTVDIQIINEEIIQTKTQILPVLYPPEYLTSIEQYIRTKLPDTLFVNVVNVGNPHVDIVLQTDAYVADAVVAQIGNDIDHFVTGGINVGFIGIKDNDIYLKVWERGAGFTLGCGSGACAAAFTAMKLNLISQNDILVHQVGGNLNIVIDKNFAITRGTAEIIFEGVMYERER